ncbi:MAG: pentapeptide repeat-containing protein [Flavitalea sp.]
MENEYVFKKAFEKINYSKQHLLKGEYEQCRFDQCDFKDASFEHTILEKANLRISINYSIDPEANKITQAKLSLDGLPGLLTKYKLDIE